MEYLFCIRRATDSRADIIAVKHVMDDAFRKYIADTGLNAIPGFTLEALSETEEDIRADIHNINVFIAFMDGIPVGSIRLRIDDEESCGYISRFGVCSGSRQMGVGRSFMVMIDKILKQRGIKLCKLYTASKNHELARFYYGCGFYIKSVSEDRGYPRALFVKEY